MIIHRHGAMFASLPGQIDITTATTSAIKNATTRSSFRCAGLLSLITYLLLLCIAGKKQAGMRHCVAPDSGDEDCGMNDLDIPWRLFGVLFEGASVEDALCTEISLTSRLCCYFFPHNTARLQDEGGLQFQAWPCQVI